MVVTVTTAAQLSGYVGGTTAMIIQIAGQVSGNFNIGSNKTIVGCGGSIQGHIGISGSSNIIVRNLKIVGNNCSDITAGMGCSTGADAVGIGNNAHHIWFDHDDISDGSDGNLDINHAADYITISWTKFWYSTKRVDTGPNAASGGHRFSDLISSSDTDTGDMGHLKTTFHHDWWADNVYERMPRVRFGQIHLFNNLYTPVGDSYCIGVGVSADIRAENNVFQNVNKPIDTTNYSDANSHMQSIGNVYTNSPPGADLNPPSFDPSTFYAYTLDPAANVPAAVMAGAGPH